MKVRTVDVGIATATAAVVCALWFAVLQPENDALQGARSYCSALQKHGALAMAEMSMNECVADSLKKQRD